MNSKCKTGISQEPLGENFFQEDLYESKGVGLSTLKEAVTRLGGVVSQFFAYDNSSPNWHEAVSFAFTLPDSGGVRVVHVDFYKEEENSNVFRVSYRCNLDGEWVTLESEPFLEEKELYSGLLFTIYIELRALAIFWELATNKKTNLPTSHLKPLNTMVELLRRDVGSYIRLREAPQSKTEAKVIKEIKVTYKNLGIDSTGFW